MTKMLLLEDDHSLGQTLKERLDKEGFSTAWILSVEEARKVLRTEQFHLLILDVGLPDGNGFQLARELKLSQLAPVIFMTAQSSAEDRLKGYELGAEEYIPKPFHLKEFILRVRHVLENHSRLDQVQLAKVLVDFSSLHIGDGPRKEAMSLKEAQILKYLLLNSPRAVSRDELLNRFWGENEFPTNRTVDNIIVRLRQLLGEVDGQAIKSVRGVGYQWIAS